MSLAHRGARQAGRRSPEAGRPHLRRRHPSPVRRRRRGQAAADGGDDDARRSGGRGRSARHRRPPRTAVQRWRKRRSRCCHPVEPPGDKWLSPSGADSCNGPPASWSTSSTTAVMTGTATTASCTPRRAAIATNPRTDDGTRRDRCGHRRGAPSPPRRQLEKERRSPAQHRQPAWPATSRPEPPAAGGPRDRRSTSSSRTASVAMASA